MKMLRHVWLLMIALILVGGTLSACKSKEELAEERKKGVTELVAKFEGVAKELANTSKPCDVRFKAVGDKLKSDAPLAKELVAQMKAIKDFPTADDRKAIDTALKPGTMDAAAKCMNDYAAKIEAGGKAAGGASLEQARFMPESTRVLEKIEGLYKAAAKEEKKKDKKDKKDKKSK